MLTHFIPFTSFTQRIHSFADSFHLFHSLQAICSGTFTHASASKPPLRIYQPSLRVLKPSLSVLNPSAARGGCVAIGILVRKCSKRTVVRSLEQIKAIKIMYKMKHKYRITKIMRNNICATSINCHTLRYHSLAK